MKYALKRVKSLERSNLGGDNFIMTNKPHTIIRKQPLAIIELESG
jgi:hypothetical protein